MRGPESRVHDQTSSALAVLLCLCWGSEAGPMPLNMHSAFSGPGKEDVDSAEEQWV